MIRSTEWFNKCINALTTTGLIVAGLGIIQAVLGILSVHVGELSIFAIYQDAASSTFADNHTFAQFMIVTIPFALVHMFTRKKDGSRFGGFVIALTMTVGLLVASSQSAILGIVVGILLLLIVYNRNFIYLALFFVGVAAFSVLAVTTLFHCNRKIIVTVDFNLEVVLAHTCGSNFNHVLLVRLYYIHSRNGGVVTHQYVIVEEIVENCWQPRMAAMFHWHTHTLFFYWFNIILETSGCRSADGNDGPYLMQVLPDHSLSLSDLLNARLRQHALIV
jgi:hypothetical protein